MLKKSQTLLIKVIVQLKKAKASDLRDKHNGSSRKDFILKERCFCGTLILRLNQLTTLALCVELSRRECARLIIA